MRQGLVISKHARERWAERGPRHSLEDELESAVPFGKETRKAYMLRMPCGMLAHCKRDGGRHVVTTLVDAHGVAILRSPCYLPPVHATDRPNHARKWTIKLVELAVRHALSGMNQDQRKKALAEDGYVPGDILQNGEYIAAFAAANKVREMVLEW